MKKQPSIDEIIAFLEKKEPKAIEKLRSDNPEFHEILKIGSILGAQEENIKELIVRAKVCLTGAQVTINKCDEFIQMIKDKLRNSKRLQLYGQILTAVGGASVLTTLSIDFKTITYIAGTITLLGSLAPMIVESQKKGVSKNIQLEDLFFELINLRQEADKQLNEISMFIDNNFNIQGIREIIIRCNQLCSDINSKRLFD
jgi:hypothetical protein